MGINDLENEAARSRREAAKSRRGLGFIGRHDKLPSVMNAPVQIRKPEVAERLRSLAEREGRTITDLVDEMTREREARVNQAREAEIQRKIAAAKRIIEEFNALPIIGPLLTDDDIYDEDGLPK